MLNQASTSQENIIQFPAPEQADQLAWLEQLEGGLGAVAVGAAYNALVIEHQASLSDQEKHALSQAENVIQLALFEDVQYDRAVLVQSAATIAKNEQSFAEREAAYIADRQVAHFSMQHDQDIKRFLAKSKEDEEESDEKLTGSTSVISFPVAKKNNTERQKAAA